MPAPENKPETTPTPPASETVVDVEQAQRTVRETTQTDHLNKKLLASLFQRLDEGGAESLSKLMEPDNKEPQPNDDKEWVE